jgi:signal transduction histidine kinase
VKQVRHNRQLAQEKKKHLAHIKAQNDVLTEVAYVQSHLVRGPLSTILGLASIYNYDDPADTGNKEIVEGIAEVANRLDQVVKDVVARENEVSSRNEMTMGDEHKEESQEA